MNPQYSNLRSLVGFAARTRLLSLLLQALLNIAIPDHEADAFQPPPSEDSLPLNPITELLLGGLGRWDATHFLFIAERGYVFEHNFAFFPLLPIVLRFVAVFVLYPLSTLLNLHGRLLLAVALVNSLLFILGVVGLYSLSCLVLQDRRLSLLSAFLYCVTPANVFLMVGYSESLFAALTFGGLWLLESGRIAKACLVLGLATGTRANGLVNAGFLVYLLLQRALCQTKQSNNSAAIRVSKLHYARIMLCFLFTAVIGSCIIIFPFAAFQYYGYQTFCFQLRAHEQDPVPPALMSLAQRKGYRLPNITAPVPDWCLRPLPLLYSYIQDVYWDVGFLRYFQLRQIPNFLLASPVTALGLFAAFVYFRADPVYCLRLGVFSRRGEEKPASGFLSPRVYVYVVHATVLLLSGFFCMHVQVLTRFLGSSSPVIYWISAHLLIAREPWLLEELSADSVQKAPKCVCGNDSMFGMKWMSLGQNAIIKLLSQWSYCSIWTRTILGYFLSYWIIGLALHCNFLPWT